VVFFQELKRRSEFDREAKEFCKSREHILKQLKCRENEGQCKQGNDACKNKLKKTWNLLQDSKNCFSMLFKKS
jgi:hypothetical protein